MISLERFEEIVQEITDSLPEAFFRELNGGVMVREPEKLHPAAVDHDLFVMGEYQRNYYLGRFVILYYGSFCGQSFQPPNGSHANTSQGFTVGISTRYNGISFRNLNAVCKDKKRCSPCDAFVSDENKVFSLSASSEKYV